MFKLWLKKAFQLIFLAFLITQISFNSVLSQENSSINTSDYLSPNGENIHPKEKSSTTSLTEDTKRVAPSNERQTTSKAETSRANLSRPSDPYEKYYDSIKKFNDELYGENG